MKKLFFSLRFQPWTVPLALFVLCLVCFGLLIPYLGYYWDDWPAILTAKFFPVSEFWAYFQHERPFAAWTYLLFAPLLGSAPFNWHLLSFLARFLSAVGMWGALGMLWPENRRQVTWAAMLFLVYPVYLEQPIAVTFHQASIQFPLFFASLCLMILGIKKPKYFWLATIPAMGLIELVHAINEYFFGAELLRPIIIWLLISRDEKSYRKRLWQTLKFWLPYLAAFTIFVGWWMYYRYNHIFPPRFIGDRNQLLLLSGFVQNPLQTVLRFLQMVAQDSLYVMLTAWYQTLQPVLLDFFQPSSLLIWAVAMAGCAGTIFYLGRLLDPVQQNETGRAWHWQALGLGGLTIILGCLPAWMTDRQAITGIFDNRFAWVAMIGAALVWVALLELLSRSRRVALVLFSILIGLSIGLHLRNANEYRRSWTQQQRYYWQLYWRAPIIKPHTLLVAEGISFDYEMQHSIAFATNLLYQQPGAQHEIAYWWYGMSGDFSNRMAFTPERQRYNWEYREYTFTAAHPDSLVLYFNPKVGKCYWILKPEDSDVPYLTNNLLLALPDSDINRIAAQSVIRPDPIIFGQEPVHDWCFYFQQADLARQYSRWDRVVELGDEALRKGFTPRNSRSDSPYEWMPFIVGYASHGRWQEAYDLASESYQRDSNYGDSLCRIWKSAKNNKMSPDAVIIADRLERKIGCKP